MAESEADYLMQMLARWRGCPSIRWPRPPTGAGPRRLVAWPGSTAGWPEPGLPGRPLGDPPGGHGSGRQRTDRQARRDRGHAPAAGREPAGRGPGLLLFVGSDPSRRRRLPGAVTVGRREGLELCQEVGRHELALEFIARPGRLHRGRRRSHGRMSAAADRPLQLERAGGHRRDGGQGPGPAGGVWPTPRPRGARAGVDHPPRRCGRGRARLGFLLDTIPVCAGADDRTARRGAGPAGLARSAPGPARYRRRRPNRWPALATTCSPSAPRPDQGLRGPTVADVAAELGGEPFDVLCDIAVEPMTCAPASPPALRRQRGRRLAGPGGGVARPRAIIGASAPAPTSTSWPRRLPTVLLGRAVADLACSAGRRRSR